MPPNADAAAAWDALAKPGHPDARQPLESHWQALSAKVRPIAASEPVAEPPPPRLQPRIDHAAVRGLLDKLEQAIGEGHLADANATEKQIKAMLGDNSLHGAMELRLQGLPGPTESDARLGALGRGAGAREVDRRGWGTAQWRTRCGRTRRRHPGTARGMEAPERARRGHERTVGKLQRDAGSGLSAGRRPPRPNRRFARPRRAWPSKRCATDGKPRWPASFGNTPTSKWSRPGARKCSNNGVPRPRPDSVTSEPCTNASILWSAASTRAWRQRARPNTNAASRSSP